MPRLLIGNQAFVKVTGLRGVRVNQSFSAGRPLSTYTRLSKFGH
jgi:hypothetical protein